MRAIVTSAVAAFVAAFGVSLKTNSKTSKWYFFYTSAAGGTNIPRAHPVFYPVINAELGVFAGTSSLGAYTMPVGISSCSGSAYYCLVSFVSTQLTAGLTHLRTAMGQEQTPVGAAGTRN